MRVLIVAYGNPSRMDDGAGHWILNRLNAAWGLPSVGLLDEPGDETVQLGEHLVHTVWLQQLDMGLSEDAAQYDRVLFLDAHVDEAEMVVCRVGPAKAAFGVTSHVLTPDVVLELAGRCWGHQPEGFRCSVRGERWDFAAELSPVVEARCTALAELVLAQVCDPAGLSLERGTPCTS